MYADAASGLPTGEKAPRARSRPSCHDGTVPPHSIVPGRHARFGRYSSYGDPYTVRAAPDVCVPGRAFVPRRPPSVTTVSPGPPLSMSPRRLTSALVVALSCPVLPAPRASSVRPPPAVPICIVPTSPCVAPRQFPVSVHAAVPHSPQPQAYGPTQNRQRVAAIALPARRPRSLPAASSRLAARLAPAPTEKRYDLTATRSECSNRRHPSRAPVVHSTNRRRAPECGIRDGRAHLPPATHRAVFPRHPSIHPARSGPTHCRGRYGATTAHVPSHSPKSPARPPVDRCACSWRGRGEPVPLV